MSQKQVSLEKIHGWFVGYGKWGIGSLHFTLDKKRRIKKAICGLSGNGKRHPGHEGCSFAFCDDCLDMMERITVDRILSGGNSYASGAGL